MVTIQESSSVVRSPWSTLNRRVSTDNLTAEPKLLREIEIEWPDPWLNVIKFLFGKALAIEGTVKSIGSKLVACTIYHCFHTRAEIKAPVRKYGI